MVDGEAPRFMTESGMRAIEQGENTQEVAMAILSDKGRNEVRIQFPLHIWEHILRAMMVAECETCGGITEMICRAAPQVGIVAGWEQSPSGTRLTLSYAK